MSGVVPLATPEGMPTAPGAVAEIVEGREALARLERPWRALSLAVERPSCFAAPAYFRVWLDVLSDDVEPFVLVVQRDGALIGIMPMMRARVRRGPSGAPRHDFAPSDRALLGPLRFRPFALRQLSPVVSMPAVLVGPAPLCHGADRGVVTAAMAARIAALRGWDSLAIPADEGAEQQAWCAALRAADLSPWVLPLGRRIGRIARVESFDSRVAAQKRVFRKNVRRARAAADAAGLVLEVHEGRRQVLPHMPELAAVAAASWKDCGRTGAELLIPYAGRQRRFVEALVADPAAGDECVPVLALARLGGQPIAALLSLRHGRRLTAIVTFRTEALPEASPGLLLVGRMMDWAHARALEGYDINATQDWARYLVDEVRAQDVVICFSRTLRGRVMGAISALARRRT